MSVKLAAELRGRFDIRFRGYLEAAYLLFYDKEISRPWLVSRSQTAFVGFFPAPTKKNGEKRSGYARLDHGLEDAQECTKPEKAQ